MTDFERLLNILSSSNVEFVIVGGVAATIHGSARLTTDLDIVHERGPENLRRLVSALRPLKPYLRGAPPGLPFQIDEQTLRAGLNFTLITSAGPLDILGEIAGVGSYAASISKHSSRPNAPPAARRISRSSPSWKRSATRSSEPPLDFQSARNSDRIE